MLADRLVANAKAALIHIRQFYALVRITARAALLAWQVSPWYTVASVCLFTAAGLLPVGQAWLIKLIVERAQAILSGEPSSTAPGLGSLLAAQTILLIARKVTGQLNLNVREILRSKINFEVQHWILATSASNDLSQFETESYYDQLALAKRNAGETGLIVEFLLLLLQNAITMMSMAAVVVRLNPWVAGLVFCLTLPQVLLQAKYTLYNWSMIQHQSPMTRKIEYYSNLLSDRASAKEIKAFGIADFLLMRRKKWQLDLFRENVGLLIKRTTCVLSFSAFKIAGVIIAWYYVLSHLGSGQITIGDVPLYMTAILSLADGFESVWESTALVHESGMSIKAVFDFLDRQSRTSKDQMHEPTASRDIVQTGTLKEVNHAIVLKDVWFRYPQTENEVIKGVNLVIAPGETVMLAGLNGAGKTTLVKLILGLYEPSRGRIELNGRDLRAYSEEELRRCFTAVFQDFVCYRMTVAENVAFDQAGNRDEVIEALEKSGAMEFVAKLPQGIDTILSKEFGGVDLSGGQWQRIALARAFFRKSPIVILDEPTAALDPVAEEEIYRRFVELKEGRTVILVSHRLSAARLADGVALMVDGSIRECGRHEELMALDGEYARLFKLQAAKYRP